MALLLLILEKFLFNSTGTVMLCFFFIYPSFVGLNLSFIHCMVASIIWNPCVLACWAERRSRRGRAWGWTWWNWTWWTLWGREGTATSLVITMLTRINCVCEVFVNDWHIFDRLDNELLAVTITMSSRSRFLVTVYFFLIFMVSLL